MDTSKQRRSVSGLMSSLGSLVVPVAVCLLLIVSAAVAQPPTVIPIAGCDSRLLPNGARLFWTSSFATDDYGFVEGSRSGNIVVGEGNTLEVTVQWSTSDPQAESHVAAFGSRGAGFSPGGVDGRLEFDGVRPELPLADPGQCDVDPAVLSYQNFTFTLNFTRLHKPPRRGGGIAKGNAHVEVSVAVGDEVVSLDTDVHVATGTDPDG